MKTPALPVVLLAGVVLTSVVLTSLSPDAAAQRWRWLDTSPVAAFSDEDWAVLRAEVRKALEEGEEGETFGWQHEKSGASGTVTLREASELDGMDCRRAKFYNSVDGMTGTSIHRLCHTADGSWRIAPD